MGQYTDENGVSTVGRYFVVSAPEIKVITPEGEVRVMLETDPPPVPGGTIDVQESSDETDEIIIAPVKMSIESNPATPSETYFFGSMSQSIHVGPGDIANGGHSVGAIGIATNNSTSDVNMAIGVEGRVDSLSGTTNLAKGILGLVVASGGVVTEAIGVSAEFANTATVTTAYGVKPSILYNTGTVGKYVGYAFPDMTGSGIANTYSIEILDPLAPIVSKAAIIEQSYGYNTPTTGQTINLLNGITDWSVVPAGTLAALTVNLPTAPIDGQNITFSTTTAITALTLGGGSNTIMNPVTTMTAGQTIEYKFYGQGINLWVRKR